MSNKETKAFVIAASILVVVGIVSQTVENNLDKEAIKTYVKTNFKEDHKDHEDEFVNFERDNGQEDSLLEVIGF